MQNDMIIMNEFHKFAGAARNAGDIRAICYKYSICAQQNIRVIRVIRGLK